MARVTVEDCEKHVDNRFDLVLMAARRARQICAGAPELVEPENDKSTVIALREIAQGLVNATTFSQAMNNAKLECEYNQEHGMEIRDTDMMVLDSESVMAKTGIEITETGTDTNLMFEDAAEEDIVD